MRKATQHCHESTIFQFENFRFLFAAGSCSSCFRVSLEVSSSFAQGNKFLSPLTWWEAHVNHLPSFHHHEHQCLKAIPHGVTETFSKSLGTKHSSFAKGIRGGDWTLEKATYNISLFSVYKCNDCFCKLNHKIRRNYKKDKKDSIILLHWSNHH